MEQATHDRPARSQPPPQRPGTVPPQPPATVASPGAGWLAPVAAVLSLLYGSLGVFWMFGGGGGYPFAAGGQGPPSILTLLPERLGAAVLAVAGVAGVVAAVTLRRGVGARAVGPLLGVAITEVVVFAVLGANAGVISLAGYLLVLLGAPAAVVFLLLGATRTRGTRWLLAGIAVVLAAVQLATGLFDLRAFRDLATEMVGGFAKVGPGPLHWFAMFSLGVVWAALAVRLARERHGACLRCGRPAGRWTRPEVAARWGWWATIVAALCPMPYALTRFTWLLPDPLWFSAAELDVVPGTKLFGMGLGTVAFCCGLVTLGLIRPWGEVWPRWMPFVAGRPVPVKAAVVPGTAAALLLGIGSTSWLVMLATETTLAAERVLMAVLFPFPLWGAAVGLATLAYYFRRRGACATCGLS